MKTFVDRHIGPSKEEMSSLLKFLGEKNLDSFISKRMPPEVLNTQGCEFAVSFDRIRIN